MTEKSIEVLADDPHDNNADIENINDNALIEAGWPPTTMIAAIVFSSWRALLLIFQYQHCYHDDDQLRLQCSFLPNHDQNNNWGKG